MTRRFGYLCLNSCLKANDGAWDGERWKHRPVRMWAPWGLCGVTVSCCWYRWDFLWGRVCVCVCVRAHARVCTLLCTTRACSVASAVFDSLWPHGLQPARLLCSWHFPDNRTGVGCHFIPQRTFPMQRSNSRLLDWQADFLLPSHQESPPHLWNGLNMMSAS